MMSRNDCSSMADIGGELHHAKSVDGLSVIHIKHLSFYWLVRMRGWAPFEHSQGTISSYNACVGCEALFGCALTCRASNQLPASNRSILYYTICLHSDIPRQKLKNHLDESPYALAFGVTRFVSLQNDQCPFHTCLGRYRSAHLKSRSTMENNMLSRTADECSS